MQIITFSVYYGETVPPIYAKLKTFIFESSNGIYNFDFA